MGLSFEPRIFTKGMGMDFVRWSRVMVREPVSHRVRGLIPAAVWNTVASKVNDGILATVPHLAWVDTRRPLVVGLEEFVHEFR